MQTGRQWTRRLFATGATGTLITAAACLSVDWPPTVASGHGGGGGGSETPEAGTPDVSEDTGDEGDGGTQNFICTVGGSVTGTCTVYVDVPSDIASDLQTACTGASPAGQVLTSGNCGTNVISCCLDTAAGYEVQTCYYSTPPTCTGTSSQTQTLQL